MLWLIVSFIFCIIVGNSRYFICCFNFVIDEITGIIVKKRLTWLTLLYSCGICGFILFGWWGARWWKSHNQPLESYNDYMLRIISTREQQTLNSCFKISFIGDLILLRPQVQRGLTTSGEYNFDNMFKHTKKYFQTDDLTIAVWEGPCAGPEHAYSNSAYGDKPFIRLNFPDTFAKAAAKAGIDCVTVSTNHVLDCGVSAIPRTLAILENESIRHVGVASPTSNQNSKPAHQMITLHDDFGNQIRIAVLAYTYGSNYVPTSAFFTGEYKKLLTCLVDKYSPYYQESLQRVKEEIRTAKAENPDCLLIMPHMGGQFNHAPNAFQKHWCTMFTELGADVILSDHPHATQPCEWRIRADGKKCLIIHCPGNYANSYTDMDGDAMAITEVYLNRKNGKPEACGVIPMWCLARGKGQYIPAPITDYIYGLAGGDLSNVDYKRLKEVSSIISKSMLGHEIPLHSASERYFTFANDEDKLIYRQASTAKLSADYISLFSIGKFLGTASKKSRE